MKKAHVRSCPWCHAKWYAKLPVGGKGMATCVMAHASDCPVARGPVDRQLVPTRDILANFKIQR